MEIVNNTDQDARVRVAGGSGMDRPDRSVEKEDPSRWPLLRSGDKLAHKPSPPGPWTVHFVINGCRIVQKIFLENSKVKLSGAGASFEAKVE